MDFLARAQRFIAGDSVEDETSLILDCLNSKSVPGLAAVQLMFEDMYGGETYNFELKAPAAYALLSWREAGMDALVESATRTPRSKNVSLCLGALAAVAATASVRPAEMFVHDPRLLDAVRTMTEGDRDLQVQARKRLREFLLSIPDDSDAMAAVGHRLAFPPEQGLVARELVAALALRMMAVSTPTLAHYKLLLAESGRDEPVFQSFFEKHPQMLDPMAVAVWPEPDLHGAKSPDFVVRRADDSYLVVEIECPSKALVTQANQPSADTTHAVSQAVDYRDFLVKRYSDAAACFPNFQEPECLVIIGLERDLTATQRDALERFNRTYNRLQVVGFDWVAKRAETVSRNMVESGIPVHCTRMR